MTNRIGKYEIQSELARGGFGLVYRAFDPTVGRLVAIKVLNTEGDKDALARFRHEAASAGNLHHKNIVTIYEYGQHNDQPFIAMEFLEGRTLQEVIASRAPVTLLEKMDIMSQVADGLYCAHRNGVIHRDVKPANIMWLPDGTVKIMDFGIARAVRHNTARLTQVGDLVGTLRYMAPEQFKITDVDALCDIFAYGVVYYELVTGQHPFEAPDAASLLYRITAETPTPIRTLVPDCPEALERLINKAMVKDREQRFPSLDELQLDAGPIITDFRRQRAGDLLEPARRQLESGDLDAAQALIRQVLELDPANRDARRLRAAVQEQIQARATRNRVEALLRNGEQFLAERKYSEAVDAFQSALRLNSAEPGVAARLESAQALLEQSRRLARCLADARRAVAAEDFDAARLSASEALEADPENAEARSLAEEIHAAVERREAERRLKDGLSAARGLILIREFDRALAILSPLRAEHPGLAAIEELITQADVQKTDQQRRQLFEKQLAEVRDLVAAARWQDAIARLESLVPGHAESRRLRALFEEARNGLAAEQRLAAIARLESQSEALLASGDFEQAIPLLEAGLRQFPAEGGLARLFERALAARSSAERDAAIREAIERAGILRREGRFEQALERISSARQDLGPVPALAELEQAIASEWRRHTESEEISKAVETGRRLISAGRLNSAIFTLREIAARYPEAEPVVSLLTQAEQQLRMEQRRANLAALENNVRAAVAGKDFDSALRQLAQALKTYPDESRLAELEQAVRAEKAVYERARVVQQVLEACDTLVAGQRYGEALEFVERTLITYPDEPALLDLEQRLRQQRDAFSQAERERRETEKKAFIAERLAAAARLESEGRPTDALRLLEEAMRRVPDSGQLAEAAGQLRQGIEEARRKARIAERIDAINRQIAAGNWHPAEDLIAAAEREFGPDAGFRDMRHRMREEQSRLEAEKQRFLTDVLERAARFEQQNDFQAALRAIAGGLEKYPDSEILAQNRKRLQERVEEAAQRQRIAERITAIGRAIVDLDFVTAARLAEAARREFPQELEFERLLKVVRDGQRRQGVGAVITAVEEKLAAGDRAAARKLVKQGLKSFPNENRLLLWQQELDRQQTAAARPPAGTSVSSSAGTSWWRNLPLRLSRPLLVVIAAIVVLAATAVWVVVRSHRSETPETARIPVLALSIDVLPLAGGRVGIEYSDRVVAIGGARPYHWEIAGGALPPGLQLNAETGLLRGTPSKAGNFSFRVEVTDKSSARAAQSMELRVEPAPELPKPVPEPAPSKKVEEVKQAPPAKVEAKPPVTLPKTETAAPAVVAGPTNCRESLAGYTGPPLAQYPGARKGELIWIWTGETGFSGRLSIRRASADAGRIEAGRLPDGVPIGVGSLPSGVTVAELPWERNQWSLVLQISGAAVRRIRVDWSVCGP